MPIQTRTMSTSTNNDSVLGSAGGVKIKMPPHFMGTGNEDFVLWVRRLEVSVEACPDFKVIDMCKLLPSRLAGAAFSYWDSLPISVKNNYEQTKSHLKSVFGQRQYIKTFQSNVNARPRLPGEPLEVYAAELTRLIAEAFPEYDAVAKKGVLYRRFLAGLHPSLIQKCYEHGTQTVEDALRISIQAEHALETTAMVTSNPVKCFSIESGNSNVEVKAKFQTLLDQNESHMKEMLEMFDKSLSTMTNSIVTVVKDEISSLGKEYFAPRPHSRDRSDWGGRFSSERRYTRFQSPDQNKSYSLGQGKSYENGSQPRSNSPYHNEG